MNQEEHRINAHQTNTVTNNANHTNDNEFAYWLAALHLPQIGPRTFLQLYEHFGTIKHIFSATPDELQALQLNATQIKHILQPDWRNVTEDFAWLKQSALHHIITYTDKNYPEYLKEICDPPLVLYVKGTLAALSSPQIAIVGARSATPKGCGNAKWFAYQLAQAGLTVVSGLALGIDSASHRGALEANGLTIAVTGAGLNHIYPHSNRDLAKQICEQNGALISEFPVNMRPLANHFPRRNRVIAGLSLGVIVVEAALKSGSLITARFANENGRDVFAMPGSIHDRLAQGCHHLIKQGAKLIETPQDVLDELGYSHKTAPVSATTPLTPEKNNLSFLQQKILQLITYDTTPIDTIIENSGLTTGEVSSILLALELQGHIQLTQGGYVRILSAHSMNHVLEN